MDKKVWVVSYPRSGNTWVRFLISNLLYPDEDVNLRSINRFVPDLHQQQSWRNEGVDNPEVIKSHYVFMEGYQRVIYVYRDGRDVAVSLYYYGYEDIKGLMFSQFLHQKFISGRLLFGSWRDHVRFWLFENHGIDFLPIKYENLLAEPLANVKHIANFLGQKVTAKQFEVAVEKSKYGNLKKIAPRNGQHPRNFGMSGTRGAWKKIFSKKDLNKFWNYAGNLMEKLDYTKEKIK